MEDTSVIPDPQASPESVAPPEPEPVPSADPSPPPEPHQHGNAGKTPWFLQRISEESAARRQAEERAAAAERRAQEAEERSRRSQGGTPSADPPRAQTPSGLDPNSPEFRSAVSQEATHQRMRESVNEIVRNGYSEFGKEKFDNAANILNALGCNNNEFLGDVLAAARGDAHKVLAEIAADPEKAGLLATMDSRSRIAELTRMQMTAKESPKGGAQLQQAAPATKQVSKAPAPAPALQPTASKIKNWRSDDASDEEFSRGFDEMMKNRAARR